MCLSTGIASANVTRVHEQIYIDHHKIHETNSPQCLCNFRFLSYGTSQQNLSEELRIYCITAKVLPNLLMIRQKKNRVHVQGAQRTLWKWTKLHFTDHHWWSNMYIWVQPTHKKQQSPKWKSPSSLSPKKTVTNSKQCENNINLLFYVTGIIHKEFVPQC